MIEKYELFIFDFDGTIIDSKEVMKKALLYCYDKHKPKEKPDFTLFFSMMGDSLNNILSRMGLPTEATEDYKRISIENQGAVKMIPKMKEVIDYLYNSNKKMAIYTGKDRKRTLSILDDLNILNYFDFVVASDDVDRPKPSPDGVYSILKSTKTKNEKAILIGDSLYDIQSAKAAGIASAFVKWGTGKEEEVRELNPEYKFENVGDLQEELRVKEWEYA
ncbi:HAD family hydrolase [Bacillus cereus]|nr:HAD family hydrolase [Bacillus cereus]